MHHEGSSYPPSPRIIIEAVAPEQMRLAAYREKGCGDWSVDDNGDIRIQVAGDSVWQDEEGFLVALHEVIEARLCAKAGVTQEMVDDFDAAYEIERDAGLHGPNDEPGSDHRAPYRRQHNNAMVIESLVRRFLAGRE